MALSDTKLRSLHGKPYSGPQEVSDADGLSARISPNGVVRFQYRYRWESKAQRLSLGRYPAVQLKEARSITADLRILYDKGIWEIRIQGRYTALRSAFRVTCRTKASAQLKPWVPVVSIPRQRQNAFFSQCRSLITQA